MAVPYREPAPMVAAEELPFGALVREHAWRGRQRPVAAVVLVVILMAELWLFFTSRRQDWPAGAWVVVQLLYGALITATLFVAYRVFGAERDVVKVFEAGLVHHRLDTVTEIRWDEIESLTTDAAARGGRHVVRAGAHRSMTFTDELTDVAGLVAEVRERTAARMVDAARTRLLVGRAVELGPFVVAPEGILFGGSRLAWREVGRVEVTERAIVVLQRDGEKWATVAAREVPNGHLLPALVEAASHECASDVAKL